MPGESSGFAVALSLIPADGVPSHSFAQKLYGARQELASPYSTFTHNVNRKRASQRYCIVVCRRARRAAYRRRGGACERVVPERPDAGQLKQSQPVRGGLTVTALRIFARFRCSVSLVCILPTPSGLAQRKMGRPPIVATRAQCPSPKKRKVTLYQAGTCVMEAMNKLNAIELTRTGDAGSVYGYVRRRASACGS